MSLVGQLIRGAGGLQAATGGDQVVEQLFGGMLEHGDSEPVPISRSFTLPAVFKAVRLFSETGGALPLISYRHNGEGRERAKNHPSYRLLRKRPNPSLDAVTFWTMALNHLASWGSIFLGKEFRGGDVHALHAVEPARMRVERLRSGELLFHERRRDGSEKPWSQRELIYVMLFTVDGVTGLSPIGLARETLRLSILMRKHGVNTFDESSIPGGALQVEETIKDPEVKNQLRREWKERHQRKRDIAVLDAGAKFEAISMPFDDAQFVELHSATRADIADFFNMPASLLSGATGDSLTYGNRESDMRQFLTFTLHNPLSKLELALSSDPDLFPDEGDYCEFLREDLLRPDSRARAEYYRHALDSRWGWMRRDEARARENLPAEPDYRPPQPPKETE